MNQMEKKIRKEKENIYLFLIIYDKYYIIMACQMLVDNV